MLCVRNLTAGVINEYAFQIVHKNCWHHFPKETIGKKGLSRYLRQNELMTQIDIQQRSKVFKVTQTSLIFFFIK